MGFKSGTDKLTSKLSVETNIASDFALAAKNLGNNANRYGIGIQCGANDASGTTYYVTCYDGDADLIGFLANTDDTFALSTVSDARTKENIRDASLTGLEIIENVKVRDFEFIKNGITKTGFVAQELKSVYPAAVVGSESDVDKEGKPVMMGVTNAQLVPALVKAIQELSAEIKMLKGE